MPTIDLKYGRGTIVFEYDAHSFDVITGRGPASGLSDAELNGRLDSPIGSPPLEDVVSPGNSVLIVVPDATREVGCGQVVNLLVRRLIANGSSPHEIRIILATGIHRKVTAEEKAQILTPFIAQRINTLDHDPRDLASLVRVGETSGGISVELNRALVESDRVILVGGVSFHYFAGFTGGRKLICPGLASSRTVSGTHRLAFDFESKGRRSGVGTGRLDGNPVHEAFDEACAMVDPAFAVTTVVNDAGEITDVFCGGWRESHRAACDAFAAAKTVEIAARRPLVIASCGGYPHDIDLIQAHKTLDAASRACADGGDIILIAECADGPGRAGFLDWFENGPSAAIAEALCQKYQVSGQTAWNLRRITERFSVRAITTLPRETCLRVGLDRLDSLPSMDRIDKGFILPAGARTNVVAAN